MHGDIGVRTYLLDLKLSPPSTVIRHSICTVNSYSKALCKNSIYTFEGLVAYDDDSQSDSENKPTSGSSHQNPNVRSFVAMSCCARFPFAGFRFRLG